MQKSEPLVQYDEYRKRRRDTGTPREGVDRDRE